jgi:hypothetical protein
MGMHHTSFTKKQAYATIRMTNLSAGEKVEPLDQ